MAQGGIALREGIARIAENNKPEAVIPFAQAAPHIKAATRDVMGTGAMDEKLERIIEILETTDTKMLSRRDHAEVAVRSVLAAFKSRILEEEVDDLIHEALQILIARRKGA